MRSHLFVVDGDLTKLSCDAWLLPTDSRFSVTASFAPGVDESGPLRLLQTDWATGEVVRRFTPERPGLDPWVWLGNVGRSNAPASHFAHVAEAFIEECSVAVLAAPRSSRPLPLLAVNMVGSGDGGGAAEKGELCHELIPILCAAADRCGVDVALVTWGRAAYAAAQRVRQGLVENGTWREDEMWDLGENADQLREIARKLARAAQNQELVLFFGAGVSVESGVPAWQKLINLVATDLGLDQSAALQLARLDLRDQAAILRQRASKENRRLGELVAKHIGATNYSLTHSLLASLSVHESITTNYDSLYEAAVGDRNGGLGLLPGDEVEPGRPWLLKLHGTIEDTDTFVLTREDYLALAARRGALLGVVQAMLLTKTMFFVGYSLSDEDFHGIVNDVRKAHSDRTFGVALTLFGDSFFNELWGDELTVASVCDGQDEPDDRQIAEAGRLVQVFLDLVGYQAADLDAYLLMPEYRGMLSGEEVVLADALEDLARRLPAQSDVAGWNRVRSLLEAFGALTRQSGAAGRQPDGAAPRRHGGQDR